MTLPLNQIKNLIIDMDGVLWRGGTPMPGLQAFFAALEELGIHYVLATNNATKIATQYTEKLARFGVEVPANCILTSAEATASFLREHYPAGTSAYIVGESGLHLAMRDKGFDLLEADGFIDPDSRVELVVVGFSRYASWTQLASAAHLINNGARFIGTNPDPTFPSEVGPLPGAGSLLAMIETATGVQPKVIGKPGHAIFQEALRRLGGTPENSAMVGDRLETDIDGAHRSGLYTILLLSGVTTRAMLESAEIQPDFVFEDITDLAAHLRQAR